MGRPLYRKLYAAYYQPFLTDLGRIAPACRAGLFPEQQRRAAPRRPFPGAIIYKDAATSTMIMDIVVIPRPDFSISPRIAHCFGAQESGAWLHLAPDTSLIYGL